MNIGTILAGLRAIASLAESMRQVPQLTPAQAEGEKPKKQPPTVVVMLPNQTPPMDISVPPPPPPPRRRLAEFWNTLPPTVLRSPVWRIPHNAIEMPVFRGIPPNTYFPEFRPDPSLEELYQLYFGTR